MALHDDQHSLSTLLARIDERTKGTEEAVKEIKNQLQTHYVTQDEFRPIRMLIYGMVGLMLTSIVGALLG